MPIQKFLPTPLRGFGWDAYHEPALKPSDVIPRDFTQIGDTDPCEKPQDHRKALHPRCDGG
jgi:hypothetical protein